MIKVEKEIYEGLEAVRDSGVTNMFSVSSVMFHAGEMGFYSTALWISDNTSKYLEGVFVGFEPS